MNIVRRCIFFCGLYFFVSITNAQAAQLDFSTFDIVDPTVSISSSDPSSLTISEDPSFAPVGVWDFDLFIPTDAVSLSFDYSLTVGAGNEDYFDFYFNDLSAPSDSIGGFEGIYAGTMTKDLAALRGSTIEIALTLNYGFSDLGFDSILTITNTTITQHQVSAVPLPAAWVLFSTGVWGVMIFKNKKKLIS